MYISLRMPDESRIEGKSYLNPLPHGSVQDSNMKLHSVFYLPDIGGSSTPSQRQENKHSRFCSLPGSTLPFSDSWSLNPHHPGHTTISPDTVRPSDADLLQGSCKGNQPMV